MRLLARVTALSVLSASVIVPIAASGPLAHAASCVVPSPGLRPIAASPVACDSGFVALPSRRIYDSAASGGHRLAHGRPLSLQVAGRVGVPSSGVVAVALNITAVTTRAATFVTVWPAGRAKPSISSLNVAAGSTRSALVVSATSSRGVVRIANATGRTGLRVDVVGYYVRSSTRGALYHPAKPSAVHDSGRRTIGASRVTLPAMGGVSSRRMRAALVNVTVSSATGSGGVTLWSAGDARPTTSTLVFDKGAASSGSALVRLSGGALRLAVTGHRARVRVDILGWYGARSLAAGRPFQPVVPFRLSDSRPAHGGAGALGADSVTRLSVSGAGHALPSDAAAVAVRITAINPSARTGITAYASGTARPAFAQLTTAPGSIDGDLVVVPLAADGSISLHNSAGSTDVVTDVVGFYRRVPAASAPKPSGPPTTTPVPPAGHYSIDLPAGLIYWGSAVGGNADPTSWETTLGAPLSARRTYFTWPANKTQLIRTLAADKAAGRMSAIAVKFGDWATVASGAQDAELRDFAATIKAIGVPVAVTPHHEPEGGGTGGVPDGPAPAFRAMIAHMLPIFRTAPNMSVGVCLMAWSFEPNSGKNPDDWWVPGVDFLGIDGYNYWGTSSKAKWKTPTEVFTRSADYAAAHGVRMMVLETGVQATDGVAGAPGSSYTWMLQLRDFLLARNALGATYFNSSLNSVAPWTLSGERLRAFEQVLVGPQIARS